MMGYRSGIYGFYCMFVFSVAIALFFSVTPVFAGTLDDYYLAQFGLQSSGDAHGKSAAMETAGMDGARCGTPLKHGLRRDWDQLEPATQKLLAKQLALPVLSGTTSQLLSPSGRFLIHYTTSGVDAVPSEAWVQTVAQVFDEVASAYLAGGWRLAPTVGGAPYDVYLRELSTLGLYGQANTTQQLSSPGHPNAFGSYIEIDNNFTDNIYVNSQGGPFTALKSLQITAAHEYHHAIQYGYNYFFEIWFGEASAAWIEDELYDDVNQLYNYIPGWFNNSRLSLDSPTNTTTGGGYGRWIFHRYLTERHGNDVVRNLWESLAPMNSTGGADIPMIPVIENKLASSPFSSTLGTEFLGFAKRAYLRDWASHAADTSRIHPAVPVATYSSYPVGPASVPAPGDTLPHYSFVYYKFTPVTSISPDLSITVSGSNGIAAAVFKKSGGQITEITPDASGNAFIVSGFANLNPATDEVVLLLINKTAQNGLNASFAASNVTQQQTLTLLFGGSGGGDVNGSVYCNSGQSCPQTIFTKGESVTLMASPNSESTFTGWSGNCTGPGNCLLTMDADKAVTASFNYSKPTRIVRAEVHHFDTLDAAYAEALAGETILARKYDFASPTGLILGRSVDVDIKGGHNASYDLNQDMTTLQGPLVLQRGSVTVERISIR